MQTGTLQLLAENASGTGNGPSGVAVDAAGNLYLADTNNNEIRKISPAGVATTLAGNPGVAGSADGTGTAATFNSPSGIAVDSAGNAYVADAGNFTIRKITSAGVVTTLAGQVGVSKSADGTGAAAGFCAPTGVAVDAAGNVYVVDGRPFSCNTTPAAKAALKGKPIQREVAAPPPGVVRKITPAGAVTTLAGVNAGIFFQFGIAVDASGNLYVGGDGNFSIVNTAGTVTVVTTRYQSSGIAVDATGNLYAAAQIDDVVMNGPGLTNILAGFPDTPGSADGTGLAATFNAPTGIAADAAGNVYVVDSGNDTIRKVSAGGVVTTIAGTAGVSGVADGTGPAAQFNTGQRYYFDPISLTVDATGDLLVGNGPVGGSDGTINKIAPNGGMSAVPGIAYGCSIAESAGDFIPPNVTTQVCSPAGIALDAAGDLFIANGENGNIVEYAANGVATEIVGPPAELFQPSSPLFSPGPIVLDPTGNLYVADVTRVVKITQSGTITLIAGTTPGGPSTGSADGVGAAARFSNIGGIVRDGAGNLYVTDVGSNTIRKIAPDTTVTTIAGSAGVAGSTDGTGNAARFNQPTGLALDAQGNLYIADSGNFTVRKMTAAGAVTTVAGVAGKRGNLVGNLPGGLDAPGALAFIDQNTLAVATSNAVLKISFSN
jgi:sugar lactone lactonase YvrE